MKSLTGMVAGIVVLVLAVGAFLAFTGGSDAEERREERRTAEDAGPAGACEPASRQQADRAAQAFLDRYLQEQGGWVSGAGPVEVGGGYVLFINTDPAFSPKKQPQCFEGVPLRYLRTGSYGPDGESVD